jgi:predicted RNA-binding protein YlxR (DUF448 family)/ribosomal protein L30E
MSDEVLVEQAGGAHARTRRCVAARAARPADGMIRFVLDPNHALVPDLAARLPGRGMWVSADRKLLSQALARNQFAKAARAPVGAPADLVEQVAAMLLRRCLDIVGLARRAGEVVAGFDQVADSLRHGGCALVLCARDGAADGRRRIEALARGVPVLDPFTRDELGGALGRDELVHVGLVEGGLARRLLMELGRLRGFREFAMPARHEAVSNAVDKGTAQT